MTLNYMRIDCNQWSMSQRKEALSDGHSTAVCTYTAVTELS